MANFPESKPIAKGTFLEKPFSHILVFLFSKKMNGTMEVRAGRDEVTIYFREGAPAKVRTTVGNRELGQVLARLKLIRPEQLHACKAKITKIGGLQGQTLIELGAIDVQTLVRGLKEQILLKLTDVFGMTDASYAFYENANHLAGFGPDEVFPIHPYPVLMAGYRMHGKKLDMTPLLTPLSGKWLSINGTLDLIRAFRLSREEKQVVGALLSGPRSFSEIAESGAWNTEVGRYVLYVMLITKQLAISAETPGEIPASLTVSLSSVPPPTRAPLDSVTEAMRVGIMDKAKSIAGQNYYEMLDLPLFAPIEEARKSFFRLSKKYHPDKLPMAIREEMKETANYIFSNLKEAHSVLINPSSREEYDSALRGEPGHVPDTLDAEKQVRDALEAESHYQRALVFLKQNRLDKARELLDEALKRAPNEGEYLALDAHLKVLDRPIGADLEDLVDKLRRASVATPNSEQVTFFLADVLKRAGKLNEAYRCFKRTLEINERNIEAAREMRFLEKNRGQSSKPPKRETSFVKRFLK